MGRAREHPANMVRRGRGEGEREGGRGGGEEEERERGRERGKGVRVGAWLVFCSNTHKVMCVCTLHSTTLLFDLYAHVLCTYIHVHH